MPKNFSNIVVEAAEQKNHICTTIEDINKLDKDKLHDPIYIALCELKEFKLPFILERKIGTNKIERWHLIKDKMYYIN